MQMANNEMFNSFSLEYSFYNETHETEIQMLIDGINILSFSRGGEKMTTKWNLDEVAFWLRDFLDNLCDDPYPVEVEGEFAAIKDIKAREYDTEDYEEFDMYYDRLDDWNSRHRWHTASQGAILADLYFESVGGWIEISWNNNDSEEGVLFDNILGGARILKEDFYRIINDFLNDYADHWFSI